MDNENKGFPNGWGDNSEDDDDYGFVDDTDEYDEDSAWGNSSSPFKKSEPVTSPETNTKTSAQSESVTLDTNNKANDDSIHDNPIQNVKQPENTSSPAPNLNVPPNPGYVKQKQKTSPFLIIVIIVLVLAVGTLGGILFMQKNREKTGDISSDVKHESSNESSEYDTEENESSISTVAAEIITTSIITTETAATTTEQEKTTTPVVADKYQIYKDKILASVNNEEYAGNDSHIENAPADMVFYDIDGTLSQISLSNAVLYAGPGSSYDEVYITRTTETLNIVGENSDWYYLMFYTGMGKFSHMTYGYASKKTSISNDSKPTASISIEPQITIHEGAHIKVVVNGDYNYYTYDFYYDGGGSYNCSWKSGTSYNSSILLDGPDIIGRGIFYVTPYYNNGTVGETVSITYEGPWKIWSQNFNSVTPVTKYGQINAPGGSPINGYTTEYIVNNGAYSCIRTDLMNNWHVTAVNSFSKNGTTWYELYDTDDGDYYGWLDESHITFY